jgi:CRISPR-associated protein Cmr4
MDKTKIPQPPNRLFFLQALSPIHIGVGEGAGAINLPTAREVVTQHPYVPGSTIKGILRDFAEQQHRENADTGRYGDDPVVHVFGPPQARAGDGRGGVVFTDARLLFLPIRSLIGGFALVTCPLILRRLHRELQASGRQAPEVDAVAALTVDDHHCLVTPTGALTHKSAVLLEDIRLTPKEDSKLDTFAQKWLAGRAWDIKESELYRPRLAVVSDTLFGFLVRLNLEVRSRVPIDDETGTAATSGPWLEEYIPAEAIFYGTAEGRHTALTEQAETEAGAEGTQKNTLPKDAQSSLERLLGVVPRAPLLRFGGKGSVGAGRALFRLERSH